MQVAAQTLNIIKCAFAPCEFLYGKRVFQSNSVFLVINFPFPLAYKGDNFLPVDPEHC